MPREMITAYAVLKQAAAVVNHRHGRLTDQQKELIVRAAEELLAGRHHDHFPLRVWMSGSGTQFNMNVNEVIANRCCQLAGTPLGSKAPVHPNDHVNRSQSTNDSFPSAMCIAVAQGVTLRLLPTLRQLRDALAMKAGSLARARQDRPDPSPGRDAADPGSGVLGLCGDAGGQPRPIGTEPRGRCSGWRWVGRRSVPGINAPPGFDREAAAEVANLSGQPFVTAPNKFAVQGCARCPGVGQRGAQDPGRLAVEDRRRHSSAEQRATLRSG